MSDAAFESLLTQACNVKRRSTNTASVDKWGAGTESITTVGSDVPCLIQQREETVMFTRRGEKVVSRHLAFFKIDAGVLEDDVIEFDGDEYRVAAVSDAAGQGHHLEVALYVLEN